MRPCSASSGPVWWTMRSRPAGGRGRLAVPQRRGPGAGRPLGGVPVGGGRAEPARRFSVPATRPVDRRPTTRPTRSPSTRVSPHQADLRLGDHLRLGLLTAEELTRSTPASARPTARRCRSRWSACSAWPGTRPARRSACWPRRRSRTWRTRPAGPTGRCSTWSTSAVRTTGSPTTCWRRRRTTRRRRGVRTGAYDLRLSQDDRDRSHASAQVVATGLLLAGAIGLLVGLLGLAQTVVRHQRRGLGGDDLLRALGQDRRARLRLGGAVRPADGTGRRRGDTSALRSPSPRSCPSARLAASSRRRASR